jgi:type IV secretion system protein VirB1
MLPGLEMMAACTDLAMEPRIMQHVARVESTYNPYAIGVVGGRLERQPRNLAEAVSTANMLEEKGYNFSLGIAQINRHNLAKYGLSSYQAAFNVCDNARVGSQILAECYSRSGSDLGKALSCYYSGNFTTGFRHGYVQKVFASMQQAGDVVAPIALAGNGAARVRTSAAVASIPAGAGLVAENSLLARRAGIDTRQAPPLVSAVMPAPAPPVLPPPQVDIRPAAAAVVDPGLYQTDGRRLPVLLKPSDSVATDSLHAGSVAQQQQTPAVQATPPMQAVGDSAMVF